MQEVISVVRQASQRRESGVYHVVLRGINRGDIFRRLTLRQIARVTGLNVMNVQRA